MECLSVGRILAIAAVALVACDAPVEAPPPTRIAAPSPPPAPPTTVAAPHREPVATVRDPAPLCATELARALAAAYAPGDCADPHHRITYRRVGVSGHDLVAIHVDDVTLAGRDGPIVQTDAMVVDGAPYTAHRGEDFDPLHLETPTSDDDAIALLEIARWGAVDAGTCDRADADLLGENVPPIAATLRSRPVGLTRSDGAVTLSCWLLRMHSGHGLRGPDALDYVTVSLANGAFGETLDHVLAGVHEGARVRWGPAPPPDPDDPLAGIE